jgi:hypothetical protein
VVPGDEDLLDLAGAVERRRHPHPVGEHRAHLPVRLDSGARHDRYFGGRHLGDRIGRLAVGAEQDV